MSLGALLAAPVACTRKPDNSALDSNVSTINVSLDASKVLVGFTTQANASLKDAVGNPINSSVGWYSSNPKVANVDPSSGVVTAIAPGVTNIVATVQGQSGSSRLVVGVTQQAAAVVADSAARADSVQVRQPAVSQASVDPPSSIAPAAASAPVAPPGQPDPKTRIAHDFNDGTFGPFENSTPGHNSIIDDPTNSGHGKVLQIKYDGVGANADLNQYAAWTPRNGPSHGSTFFFRGDLYYPASTPRIMDGTVLRKIIYFRTDRGDNKQCDLVLFQYANRVGVSVQSPAAHITKYDAFTLKIGAWNTVQMQVTTNSRPGVSDGILRVWHDGTLAYENSQIAFTGPADPQSTHWSWLTFGHQREGAPGDGAINEVRYWDNIIFTMNVAP